MLFAFINFLILQTPTKRVLIAAAGEVAASAVPSAEEVASAPVAEFAESAIAAAGEVAASAVTLAGAPAASNKVQGAEEVNEITKMKCNINRTLALIKYQCHLHGRRHVNIYNLNEALKEIKLCYSELETIHNIARNFHAF